MAEWFVGPIMGKLIDTCSEYLQDQFRWQIGMKKELERLREHHPKIQAVVSAASQAQMIDQNSALNKWIWQLRDAIDEVDDPNLARLEEVVQKLDRVSAEVSTFIPLLESTKKVQQELQLELYKTRETGSLPKNDLIGRDKEKEFVMQWLKKLPNEVHQTHNIGVKIMVL